MVLGTKTNTLPVQPADCVGLLATHPKCCVGLFAARCNSLLAGLN